MGALASSLLVPEAKAQSTIQLNATGFCYPRSAENTLSSKWFQINIGASGDTVILGADTYQILATTTSGVFQDLFGNPLDAAVTDQS